MILKVFLPDELQAPCYIWGEYEQCKLELVVYITAYSQLLPKLQQNEDHSSVIYGHFGAQLCAPLDDFSCTLIISETQHRIVQLKINREDVHVKEDALTIIIYDYEKMRSAECWYPTDPNMRVLLKSLQTDAALNKTLQRYAALPIYFKPDCVWIYTSCFCFQFITLIESVFWLYTTIKRDKKISIRTGNVLVALLADVTLGCCVLSVLDLCSRDCSDWLMHNIEVVVEYLRSLLQWLMGAPAGLKLNAAFNNMLGKFFLYHIDLWWKFLDLTRDGLHVVWVMVMCCGYVGASLAAAGVADIVSFLSFHAYCIYVYVARLFKVQVSGLAALLRLFVGRKRNPLRDRVDSCACSGQQLFVGAVAFTALIFLLPTTAMYYVVFTLFRVMALCVRGALRSACGAARALPLYVCALYVADSRRVAGAVCVSASAPRVLRLRLRRRSLAELVRALVPPAPPPRTDTRRLLYSLVDGTLIA